MDWQRLASALARHLVTDQRWRTAVAQTPRHPFVPRFFTNEPGHGWCAIDSADDCYARRVYSNEALITQLDGDSTAWEVVRHGKVYLGGHPTASASAPQLVVAMLDALNASPGMDVLEIGTGTGYNAALLCHVLGDAHVTTIDIDEPLVAQARERLAQLGHHPRLAVADATQYVPDGPFDRIIATVGIHRVPSAWLSAVRDGGRILVHPYSDLTTDAVFALTVHENELASGHAPIGGYLMPTRDNLMPYTVPGNDIGSTASRPTQLPGEVLAEFGAFYLFASLVWRDVQIRYFDTKDGGFHTGVVSRDDSWAYEVDGTAVHAGSRDLWAELEHIHARWEGYGSPGRERLGMTVTSRAQTVWIDTPEQVIHTD